jgi:hypothetical protein
MGTERDPLIQMARNARPLYRRERVDRLIAEAIAAERERIIQEMRVLHNGNQWQDGGTHPNVFDLSKCGECSAMLDIILNKDK